MYKLSENSKKNLTGVDNKILEIIELALQTSKIDFGIPEDGGVRTAKRQNELYKKGVSQCDGYNNLSTHQLSIAFDIYAYVDGKASWDRAHLTTVAAGILQSASVLGYHLVWGGNWKNFVDMPHFELIED